MKVLSQDPSRSNICCYFSKKNFAANVALISGITLVSFGYLVLGSSILGGIAISTSCYVYFKPTKLDKKVDEFVLKLIIAMEYRVEAHKIKGGLAVARIWNHTLSSKDLSNAIQKLNKFEWGQEFNLQALETLKNELIDEAYLKILKKLKIEKFNKDELINGIEVIIILAILVADHNGTILNKSSVKNLIKKNFENFSQGQTALESKNFKDAFQLTDIDTEIIFREFQKTKSFGAINLVESILKNAIPINDKGAGIGEGS
jgi:hypothetical protein